MSDELKLTTKTQRGLTRRQVEGLLTTDRSRVETRVAYLMGNMTLPASRALAFYVAYCRAVREQGGQP